MAEKKENRPVLAICYDFDKTLSPTDMQAQGYIQALDYEVGDFWTESNALAKKNDMDQNLAYMYMMTAKSRGKAFVTREMLKGYGSKVQLFPGVATWFDRINAYGEEKGIRVEHYIISSGLKEMIEGTSIADKFTKIYASSFYFDDTGVAVWPAQVVNYTDKTQYLFRIEKGVLDVNNQDVNSVYRPDELRVPFRNMVYIGDSDTDIPCMKLVNINGGHSIGVYNPGNNDKSKVFSMLEANRIKYYAAADYSERSRLEELVKNIIDRTRANELLEQYHNDCIAEEQVATRLQDEAYKKREALINRLEDSGSFSNSHTVIHEMAAIPIADWAEEQIEQLLRISIMNGQVRYIIGDTNVKPFYRKICARQKDNKYAIQIMTIINKGSD